MESRSFYNEILTEHNLRPEYKHDLPDANIVLEGVNPNCGDDIFLKLKVENDVIEDGAFVGDGCAISQASADIMLGMILGKTMEVKTIAVADALPGAVAIVAAQVVGHLSVCLFNDKIVCILAVRVCHSLFKPFMLIGTVIDNEIHQHADPCLFRTLDQFFEIFICAERRINFHIIGDIISAVFHR